MFRKGSHIVLTLLLLVTTTGLAVSKHYCGNFLVSTSFFADADPCCDDGSCCHDETNFFQLDEDFSVPASSSIPPVTGFDLYFFPAVTCFLQSPEETENTSFNALKPPPVFPVQTLLSLRQAYLL